MKTLSPEQLRMLCDVAYDSVCAAWYVPSDQWLKVAPIAERAAVNLDQVLMELDDE